MERAQKGGTGKKERVEKIMDVKPGGSRSLKQQKMKHCLLECLQRTSMRSLS